MTTEPGPLADREWRLIREDTRRGPMQMALDEVAAETAADGGPRTVRLYRWDPSCLSLGCHQRPDSVDWNACEANGVDVTRRQTGGGGIYHDNWGDISYSIVAPAEELPGDLMDCYHLLCEPILDAFRELGIDANYVAGERPSIHQPACYLRKLNPAHDVVSEDGAGRKLAGNAQYRRKDAVIQHGSITFSVDAENHLDCFAEPETTPAEFRDRVVGIDELADVSRAEAVSVFEETLTDWADAEEGNWQESELERGEERVAEKYENDEWVKGNPRER